MSSSQYIHIILFNSRGSLPGPKKKKKNCRGLLDLLIFLISSINKINRIWFLSLLFKFLWEKRNQNSVESKEINSQHQLSIVIQFSNLHKQTHRMIFHFLSLNIDLAWRRYCMMEKEIQIEWEINADHQFNFEYWPNTTS